MTPRTAHDVDHLLSAADRLLTSAVPGARGLWPRASAWIIRIALEQALRDLWIRKSPGIAKVPMRAQLLMLSRYTDQETARRARAAWAGLSRAGHHHGYELAPTAGELRRWHEAVRDVSKRLREEAA